MKQIDVSDATFERLEALAIPFQDKTPEDVVLRAISALEVSASDRRAPEGAAESLWPEVSPTTPPDLTHTKVMQVKLDGAVLPTSEAKWNAVMRKLICVAAESGSSPEELTKNLYANATIGRKTDHGYEFVEPAGISVQGQDSNGAWRTIRGLCQAYGHSIEIRFAWYDKQKAARPGERATLRFP